MKTDRKPPLAKSPMKLRTRLSLRPANTNTPLRTPMGSLTKHRVQESEIWHGHHTVACQFKALSKIVQDELNVTNANNNKNIGNSRANNNVGSLPQFERDRLYDKYSARRNERLMEKKRVVGGGNEEAAKSMYNLGVKVESAKKDSKKKTESLKKSISAGYASVDRSQHPRYSLRNTVKKPPLPVPMYVVEEKVTASRASRRN